MGLSPKKDLKSRNQTWIDIDDRLQSVINFVGDSATIKLSEYPTLSKAEIISEAEKNNYTVLDKNDGYLVFS
ncbi:hypothetical protein GCM10025878_14300 [Leuconostoc gasicomitatum]|uniref:hypothetical protein n=1 Tax=Leuconostoc gasicomitatum TaxID=115778 RepID=UPI0005A25D0E|nr:hypothetical protein [Leuconostoc gasicomitatum]GMA06359.1 hypothetical protein GCM10025878_14300 [Leuconostoc gasicomitatum]